MRNISLALALAAALTSAPAQDETAADDERAKLNYRESDTSPGWSASTPDSAEAAPETPPDALLTVRIYRNRGEIGPAYGPHGKLLATDVTAEIERCADGGSRIDALRIGTWRFVVEGSCEEDDEARLVRCDPETWTCSAD